MPNKVRCRSSIQRRQHVLFSSLDRLNDTGDEGDDEADGTEDLEERSDLAEDAHGLRELLATLTNEASVYTTASEYCPCGHGRDQATLDSLLGLRGSL